MAVTFTSEAAKRIKAAVLRVESMPPQSRSGMTAPAGPHEESFWAWLSGADTSGVRFSWARCVPDFSSDSPDIVIGSAMKWRLFGDPPVAGFGTAYEVNGRRGIQDDIVRLHFAGIRPDDGQPVYLFSGWPPDPNPIVPIHDHRSNEAGGFAFGVFHPGTKLPQQPFAL